jgi:hypothetical protein
MYDIKTKDYTYTNVARVEREKTPKVVYVQVMPETYKIKMSDINFLFHARIDKKRNVKSQTICS